MKIFGKRIEPAELILSLLGLIVLTALFLVWRIRNPDTTPLGVCAALISAAVFAVFGVRLVFAWMREWRAVRGGAPVLAVREPVRTAVLLEIFAVCLVAEVAALLLVYVFQVINGSRESFWEAAEIWGRLDSQHYFAIAEDWYLSEGDRSRLVQLVFLPGYPLMLRLFAPLVGSWLKAGILVSALSFSGAGVVLYLLARLDTDHAGALRTLKYTLILPGAFFFAAPMSEALFFLLSISCFYCIRRSRWLPAGILGGLAAFTRSLGLMLIVPAVYTLVTELIAKDSRDGGKLFSARTLRYLFILLIPAGFGVYCLICKAVSGDPLKFLEYQREHWSQSPGFFFNTAAYQTERIVSSYRMGDYPLTLGLWIPNVFCSLFSLAVMALAARRLKPVYSVYFIAYYVIAIGTTWLLSAPRYLVACFPVSLGLAGLTDDRRADGVLTILLTVLYCLYALFMALRWQVW